MNQSVISEDFNKRVSECIQNEISKHLYLDGSKSNDLVSEDVLFNHDKQFETINNTKEFETINGIKLQPHRKLTEVPIIRTLQSHLSKIDVVLHLSNENTFNLAFMWGHLNMSNSGTFYTNTNLIIKIDGVLGLNQQTSRVRMFTTNREISFDYGTFDCDGKIWNPMYGPYQSEEGLIAKLIECKDKIYKYIHPWIYLDYYMHCATEQEMNDLVFSRRVVMEKMALETDLALIKRKLAIEINDFDDCNANLKESIHYANELKKNNEALQSKNSELEKEIKCVSRDKKDNLYCIQELQKDNDFLRSKNSELEKKFQELTHEMTREKEANIQMQKANETKNEHLERQIERLERRIAREKQFRFHFAMLSLAVEVAIVGLMLWLYV
jgi:hypothetical protein